MGKTSNMLTMMPGRIVDPAALIEANPDAAAGSFTQGAFLEYLTSLSSTGATETGIIVTKSAAQHGRLPLKPDKL